MKNSGRMALAIAVIAGVVGGQAQGMNSFDFYAANMDILQFREVQTELKVTAAQRTKLNTHADWFNAEIKKVQAAAQKAPNDPKHGQAANRLVTQLKQRALRELTAAQLKRLREISLQAAGPLIILDPQVAKQIGLTAAQTKKISDAAKKNSDAARALQERTMRPILAKYEKRKPKNELEAKKINDDMGKEMEAAGKRIQPQITNLINSTRKTIDTTMTAAQKNRLTALLGRPFTPPQPKR